MSRLPWLLLCLLLLVSVPTYSVVEEEYPPMSQTEIAENFIAVYDELDQAYRAYMTLFNGLVELQPRLQAISLDLRMGAELIATMQQDMQRIESAQRNYVKAVDKKVRETTIQAYVIGATAILAALLIAIIA